MSLISSGIVPLSGDGSLLVGLAGPAAPRTVEEDPPTAAFATTRHNLVERNAWWRLDPAWTRHLGAIVRQDEHLRRDFFVEEPQQPRHPPETLPEAESLRLLTPESVICRQRVHYRS